MRLGAESAAAGRGTAAVPAGAAAEAVGGVAAAGGVDVAADVASPHAAHRQVNSRQLTAMRDLAPILTGCRGLIFDEKPLRTKNSSRRPMITCHSRSRIVLHGPVLKWISDYVGLSITLSDAGSRAERLPSRRSVLREVSGRSHAEACRSGRSGSLTRSVMPKIVRESPLHICPQAHSHAWLT